MDSFVRWNTLSTPFGYAGTMWQGWAVGNLTATADGTALVSCAGVEEYFIDDIRMRGDMYGSGYGSFPVTLSAGTHIIRVRLSGEGNGGFGCNFHAAQNVDFMFVEGDDIVPDIVDDRLVSAYASIVLLNLRTKNWLKDVQITCSDARVSVQLLRHIDYPKRSLDLAPAQVMPIHIQLTAKEALSCPFNITLSVSADGVKAQTRTLVFNCVTYGSPFRFTFLDADHAVHYAVAIPPLNDCPEDGGCPVLLSTHGAGVKADGGAWVGSYSRKNLAWILLPTGKRDFGFDWEGVGRVNALYALSALADIYPRSSVAPQNKVDVSRVLFAGHSMGGHGCLELCTHEPDRALGCLPAAGWIKHTQYHPFYLRLGDSYADPILEAILASANTEHSTDIYSVHLKGIPTMVRMGGNDDNVPPWHLRRFARLLNQREPGSVHVSEVPGQGHWWDGVVDDSEMDSFIVSHIKSAPYRVPLPDSFTMITMNPASSGTKGGVKILQLQIPYRLARISVDIKDSVWSVRTENVRRFGIQKWPQRPFPGFITVNGQPVKKWSATTDWPNFHLCLHKVEPTSESILQHGSGDVEWKICEGFDWQKGERGPSQYGPARQVLEGPLSIIYGTNGSSADVQVYQQLAIGLSSDLYMQGRFGVSVYADEEIPHEIAATTNVIMIGRIKHDSISRIEGAASALTSVPVSIQDGGSNGFGCIVLSGMSMCNAGLGIQYLSPWANYKLALLISGTDVHGVKRAAKLFPKKSGLEVPDFVITDPSFGAVGAGGILAAGYWSNHWSFEPQASYVRRP
eukprot:GILJ01005393.1.p1 GENE.GILJ01005393.1~~GILJ01005393.1.p1  ORF type:complete len:925 (+),score=98.11 GILJ01005393.1:392-2776(+)